MFKKILVANRGEIALRVICACKELGISTVAVFSEADEHSLHTRFADEAVCIGPAKSRDSYLNIPSIISAAEITNVDGIHPGYGYLAESSYFAEVCETCGIKFIGPTSQNIELMGDKAKALEKMAEAGLPVIPGCGVLAEDRKAILKEVEAIGYPLMIKAVAGGGGKGMRIVRDAESLFSAIETARSEAQGAFGNSEVYLERFLDNPRHIEFQIIADQLGNVVHLGERECSIQRRHQKLIEETPSPVVSAQLRGELGHRVVTAVSSIGYQNAGTVEFLFDQDGNHYFIEMNTRVQVEHPVTEMTTGIDIVKAQIQVAAGEALPFHQSDIQFEGHSIECRINAEDPVKFTPSPGEITAYHAPGGPGIRVDSGAYQNWVVSPHYDSLISKLIAHGGTRDEALARLERALDMFVIEGIGTSIELHKRILAHPDFRSGNYGTRFLENL